MAASVTLKGSTYSYTVSNVTNTITLTPANRSQRYGQVYTTKPTVKRNKSGAANTRYIFVALEPKGTSGFGASLAIYKATFTKTGTTATVTEAYTGDADPLGTISAEIAAGTVATNGYNFNISMGTNVYSAFDDATASYSLNMSGWNPAAPSMEAVISQSAPPYSVFGYVKGFCTAPWKATAGTTWSYSLNGNSGIVSPKNTLVLSANGASETNGPATGMRTATLATKILSATSVTGTAKVTNNIGGTATATKTLTCQDYVKPSISGLKVGRSGTDLTASFNWAVAEVNKSSTQQTSIRDGAITASWRVIDSTDGSTVIDTTSDIIEDGDPMTATAGTMLLSDDLHEYDTEKSYKLYVKITDRLGQDSTEMLVVLPTEFYTIDFCARGRGVALGTIAEQGYFKVSNELRPQLSGVMSQGLGTCWSAATEDAPYGRNNIALGIGSDGNNKGIWCSEYNGVAGHWMIHETEAGEALLNKFFPVGSVVITYTNSSPASRFGGSWSLFDKEYKYSWVSSGFTFNSTNTTEGSFVALCTGKAVELRITWKNKVAISDDTVAIGTMNMSNIGMSAVHTSYGLAWNDALGGIGMVRFAWTNGVLTLYVDDWTTRATSYPTATGQWCYLSAVILAQGTSMTDSFCDKFYWRRTE